MAVRVGDRMEFPSVAQMVVVVVCLRGLHASILRAQSLAFEGFPPGYDFAWLELDIQCKLKFKYSLNNLLKNELKK